MPLDPVLVEDTRNWLIKATEDLDMAKLLIEQKRRMINGAAFHLQQAVEKVLKVFLTWHDRPFKRNHDLKELASSCKTLDAEIGALAQPIVAISPWAIRTRYPGNWIPPTKSEVSGAMRDTKKLFRKVLSRLPKPTHPS